MLGKRGSEVLLPDGNGDLVGVLELEASGVLDSQVLVGELDDLDNVDSVSGDLVVSSHLVVELVDCVLDGDGSELLEHVLLSDVALVLEVDSEVLGLDLSAVEDLLDFEDLSVGLLDLVLASHDLPELGLGEGGVLGNDFHHGDFWLSLGLAGALSSVDVELSSSFGVVVLTGLFYHRL